MVGVEMIYHRIENVLIELFLNNKKTAVLNTVKRNSIKLVYGMFPLNIRPTQMIAFVHGRSKEQC